MINKYKNAILITLVIIILLLTTSIIYSNRVITQKDNLIEALGDTVTIWRDKDGLSNSKIQTLQTSRVKDFLAIKSKDKQITDLQTIVKKYEKEIKNGGSVTNFTSVTKVTSKGKTIVIPKDTITINDVEFIYPTYKYDYVKTGENDEFPWITGHIESNMSDTEVSAQIINKYSVILGEESQGWFKKKKPFVKVTNYNPYSETTELKTYEVTPIKKTFKFKPGLYGGYGATLIGNTVKTGFQVGGGLIITY